MTIYNIKKLLVDQYINNNPEILLTNNNYSCYINVVKQKVQYFFWYSGVPQKYLKMYLFPPPQFTIM